MTRVEASILACSALEMATVQGREAGLLAAGEDD
jgi:hypothetical protein